MSTDQVDISREPVTAARARGLHVFDLEAIPFEPPAKRPGADTRSHGEGVEEKWLVKPTQGDPADDRFPVSIVRFPPNLTFPRHWHTDGEFISPLRGSMMVGGAPVREGGLGYNDARTIYGAEAAGADGCDFLMVRRAWASNNLMLTDDDVAGAVAAGITDSQDRVAPLTERGLHVLLPEETEWEETSPGGSAPTPRLKRLIAPKPDPGEDRFPISLVRLPAGYTTPRHASSEGLLVRLLEGEVRFDGAAIAVGGIAYVDGGCDHVVAAGPDGADLLVISRKKALIGPTGPDHQDSPARGGTR